MIHFKLVDLNLRSYNHEGGYVVYKGESIVEPGAFKYKYPCPTNGKHKYDWTGTAKSPKFSFGGTTEKAKASNVCP